MFIEEVIELLEQEYGPREWQPGKDSVGVLIETVLSQNTTDINSGQAFNSLSSTFGNWEAVASAPVECIARAIEIGGLSRIKSARIKQILNRIEEERGCINLDFLSSMGISEAKNYLLDLPGVGLKTANCVLLFALGKPCLPVDTHVFRVARRVGLIDSNISIGKAHDLLQEQVPLSKVYQFHLYMIEHGRQICLARQPHCVDCVLKNTCPSSLVPWKVVGA
ncbi:MAG: endonuclease III [Dehalococcoidia bacterium]|nr:endonuclease III [Dehalococcoidia bacterium]